MPDNAFRHNLLKIATDIAAASPQVFRLAHNEANVSRAHDKEAAHFLKLNEKRFGRDIELYGLMELNQGRAGALVQFAEEIVLPLKKLDSTAYAAAVEGMRFMGDAVFPDKIDDWMALFEDAAAAAPGP